MGFNLIIGEKVTETDDDGDTYVTVKTVRLDNAPADDVPTDYTNERWPSYIGWADFYEAVGLRHIFTWRYGDTFKSKPLLEKHPGWVKLTTDHKSEIDRAYQAIKTFIPEHQVRLEWLKFWVDWALDNCTCPIFKNS